MYGRHIISTVAKFRQHLQTFGNAFNLKESSYPVAICLVAESCFHKTPDLQSGGGDKSQNQTTDLFKQALKQQTLASLKYI